MSALTTNRTAGKLNTSPQKCKGFSLIELLIAMLIATVIGTMLTQLLISVTRLHRATDAQADLQTSNQRISNRQNKAIMDAELIVYSPGATNKDDDSADSSGTSGEKGVDAYLLTGHHESEEDVSYDLFYYDNANGNLLQYSFLDGEDLKNNISLSVARDKLNTQLNQDDPDSVFEFIIGQNIYSVALSETIPQMNGNHIKDLSKQEREEAVTLHYGIKFKGKEGSSALLSQDATTRSGKVFVQMTDGN